MFGKEPESRSGSKKPLPVNKQTHKEIGMYNNEFYKYNIISLIVYIFNFQ